jgi:hypothetical protein
MTGGIEPDHGPPGPSRGDRVPEDGLREGGGATGTGLIHQNLGTYYKKNGQPNKAKEHFETAYTLADTDKDVDKEHVQDRINKLLFGDQFHR